MSTGALPDASGGILSVTAPVIEAKSTSLYLLCRTVIHRAAEAAATQLSPYGSSLRSFNNTLIDLSPCRFFHSL